MATFSSPAPRAEAARGGGDPSARRARRLRLTLDLPAELHLRLKLLAAHERVAMRDIVEALLDQGLPPLEELAAPRTLDVTRLPAISAATLDRFVRARADILRGRTFTTDSAELLREARDEDDARLDDAKSGMPGEAQNGAC
jgi:hypothetical protein